MAGKSRGCVKTPKSGIVFSCFGRFGWAVSFKDRRQDYLLPASLDDYVSEDNPVRAVEVFIDALDLKALKFAGMTPAETGRPAYHPATMLKIYLYGYLNRVQSSRRSYPSRASEPHHRQHREAAGYRQCQLSP